MNILKRLENFRARFDELGIDAALVYGDYNRNYLSGFTGHESFSVILKDKAYFLTDGRYIEQANAEVVGYEVIEYKPPIHNAIKELLLENNVKVLGIEEDRMTYSDYFTYKELLEDIQIVKLSQTIEKLRMIKEEEEIELIAKAASIADMAFEHIIKFLKVGAVEKDIALELEYFMKKHGAEGLSFNSIVVSGARSSLPHGTPSDKKIEYGDFVTLDFGCIYKGYCSDMTRTVVVGKASDKHKEIYNAVLDANEAALKAIKAGLSCFDADRIARDIIKERGYGDKFGHGLGHGVGMEVHEMPRLNFRSNEILQAGMVVTDEPGIYVPNFGGVRIEELVVVTEDGYRVLSKSPKHLMEL
ncbi:putative peptidase [Caloramator mitchellensis]|uniref:Putative peptidase n=1 Tax=Caloramator mitchellensis TaxID=908809 RepID=A0A0R3K016_CALMK|nr:aminopeptidase P family protein [Caloramator mitchellensis]KRQ86846.1 putative peptidase [Caloramator mitchellensis]